MNGNDFSKIGFDYGVKPYTILIGNMEFSDLFQKANCIGVLYVFDESNKDEKVPVQMAFLFQNEEPAEKFLDILLDWVEKSKGDGDAVSLDFIENKKGGYTLSISPEVSRFVDRIIPKNIKNKVSPITMVQAHYKEIDSLGENYLNFKANHKKAGSIAIGYVIGTPSKIVNQSKRYFTKKEFNFYKENEIPQDSMASGYKRSQKQGDFNPQGQPKPPKDSIEEIKLRRVSEMKNLLPMTYNRLSNQWLGDIQKKLRKTFDTELINQAICNLTVFERLKKIEDLSPDFTNSGYPSRILEYLTSTYESFDSYYPDDVFYTEELIINQLNNDKSELEAYLNK